MKRALAALLASLLLSTTPALAGDHERHGRHDYGQRGFDRDHDRRHDRRHDRHRHRQHSNAIAWGLAGLAVGSILLSVDASPSPPPVVVTPTPVRPPGTMWYYCDAYGTYYPYVGQCPGGWRAVPAY